MKFLRENEISRRHQILGVMLILMILIALFGMHPVNAEGEETVEDTAVEVASIGDKKYTDIRQAVVEAQAGETIVLLEDVQIQFINPDTVPKDPKEMYVADFADNVTFDLNGHTLTNAYMSFIFQGDNLTIKNGNIKSQVDDIVYDYGIYIGDVRTTSGIVMENVTVDGGINVFNTSVTLKNVNATGHRYYSVWADENSTINIESGTYKSDGVAVVGLASRVNQFGPVEPVYINIKGGNYIIENQFTLDKATYYQPTIYGGTFNCDVEQYLAEGVTMEQNENGDYVVGYKIELDNSQITGGSISVSKTIADAGEKIQISYQAEEGYKLKEISVIDSNGNNITLNSDNTFIMPEGNVTISAMFEKCSTEVTAPEIDITEPVQEVEIGVTDLNKVDEILKSTLTEIVKDNPELNNKVENADVTIKVEIDNNATIEETIKEKIETAIKGLDNNTKIADYFDILIEIKANNIKVGEITELNKPIALIVALPETLQKAEDGYSRTYYIIREHNNETEILNTTLSEDGKYLTFESDKFSSFALAFVDKKIEEDKEIDQKPETTPSKPVNVDTGSSITENIIALAVAVSGICILFAIKKKKYSCKH